MNDESGRAGGELLDAIDRRLLTALQEDGRVSYASLGRLVGLSTAGARLRVRRLREEGVLQIVAVTDPLRLGHRSMAQVSITVDGDVRAVADALGELPEVVYVVLVAGRFDIIAEVVAPDSEGLLRVVNDRVRLLPGIVRAEISPFFGIHTHRFTWDVPPHPGDVPAGDRRPERFHDGGAPAP